MAKEKVVSLPVIRSPELPPLDQGISNCSCMFEDIKWLIIDMLNGEIARYGESAKNWREIAKHMDEPGSKQFEDVAESQERDISKLERLIKQIKAVPYCPDERSREERRLA